MSNYKQFRDIHTGEWQNLLWNFELDRADPSTFGMVRWHNRGPVKNVVTRTVTQPYRLPRDETELVGRDTRPEARAFLNRIANELRQKIAKLQYPPREPNDFLDVYDVLRQRYRNEYRLEIENGTLPDVDESDAYHWQVYTWYPSQLRRFEESLPTVKEYGTYPNPDSDVGWFTEHRWDVQNWDYKNRSAGLFPLTTHDNITELTGRCEPLVNFGIKKITSDYHSGASDLRYACCNGPMGSEGCIIGYPMEKENNDELLYNWFGGKKHKDVLTSKMDPLAYLRMAMKYRGVAFEDRSDADVYHEEIQNLYGQLTTDFWDNIRNNNGQLDPEDLREKDLVVLSKIAEWMYQYNSLVTKQGPRMFPNASMARLNPDEFRAQMLLHLKKTMGDFIKSSVREQEEEKRRKQEQKRYEEQERKKFDENKKRQEKEQKERVEEEKMRQDKEKMAEEQKKQKKKQDEEEQKRKEEEKKREEIYKEERKQKREKEEQKKNVINEEKMFQDAIKSCQKVVNAPGVTFKDIVEAWRRMRTTMPHWEEKRIVFEPMEIESDNPYITLYELNQENKGLQKIILCDSFNNDKYSRGEVIKWCNQALKKILNVSSEYESELDIDYTDIKKLQKYWYDTIKTEEEEQARVVEATRKMKEEREKESKLKEQKELQQLEEEKKKAEEQQNRDLEEAEENLKKAREAVNKEREQFRQEQSKKIEYIKKANECIDKAISIMQDPKKNETLQEIIDNWNEIIVCIERNAPNILNKLKITKIETPDFENIPISTQFNWFIQKEYLLEPNVLLLTTFRDFCTAKTTIDVIKNAFVGELRNPGMDYKGIDSKPIMKEMNKFIDRRDLYKKLDNDRSEKTLKECLQHIYNVNESGHALKDIDGVYQEALQRLKNKNDFNIILNNVLHMLKHGNIQSGRINDNIFKGFSFVF